MGKNNAEKKKKNNKNENDNENDSKNVSDNHFQFPDKCGRGYGGNGSGVRWYV